MAHQLPVDLPPYALPRPTILPPHLSEGSLPGSVHTRSATPSVPSAPATRWAAATTSSRPAPEAAAAPATCTDLKGIVDYGFGA